MWMSPGPRGWGWVWGGRVWGSNQGSEGRTCGLKGGGEESMGKAEHCIGVLGGRGGVKPPITITLGVGRGE